MHSLAHARTRTQHQFLHMCLCAEQIATNADPLCPAGVAASHHHVIWSVPYESQWNPIEQVWAAAKGYASARNSGDSTVQSVQELVRQGYYGDGKQWTGLTAERCTKLIGHTRGECDRWIARSPALKALFPAGTTANLKELNAVRRAAYGPIPTAHRITRSKRRGAVDAENDEEGDVSDDDGELESSADRVLAPGDDEPAHAVAGSGAAPPPRAPAASASASASGSGSVGGSKKR
jgi:hypothetical protein